MMATPKRALVTGAGGFVGGHLVERLARDGWIVRAFVRYTSSGTAGWLDRTGARGHERIEIVAGDIRDERIVREAARGADVIFHLAALVGIPYSYGHPREVVDTNVYGTLNVLLGARDEGAGRIVFASTSEVYGSACAIPMDESHPLRAQSPYAASKIAAEKLVESFHASYGTPTVVLRPFNVYGPRQSRRAIVATLVAQALVSPRLTLGNTKSSRDFTFVTDTVDAFVRAGTVPEAVGGVYNVGSGSEISVGDLARLIGRFAGHEAVEFDTDAQRLRPEASEVTRLCADARRARSVLGWSPAHTLETGLQATVAWFRENRSAEDPAAYAV
jgi:dTDP-glucose 4,6-dehydratase